MAFLHQQPLRAGREAAVVGGSRIAAAPVLESAVRHAEACASADGAVADSSVEMYIVAIVAA